MKVFTASRLKKKIIAIMSAEISIVPDTARPYADARFSEDPNSNMTSRTAPSSNQFTVSM